MKRIKYISYYDTLDSTVKRNYVLAASNKMDYIISALNKSDVAVDVISFSGCISDKFCFDRGGLKNKGINTIKYFSSFGPTTNGIFRLLSRWWQTLQFVLWFLFNVKSNEQILIYHSLGYCKVLTLLKRVKKCIYIGEIEEIYQDVSPTSKYLQRAENAFIECCDKYMFPTQLLNTKLNINGKPYLVIHGIYEVETLRNVSCNDTDIHVVYAGTFDPNKGCCAAAAAAEFLPQGYHIHICGFGTHSDTLRIQEVVEQTAKKSQSKVTFDGLLKGEEFICFLQKCHIGLSPQSPDAAFNMTSFPSKILTYLANGLSVVSIRIPAIEDSKVSSCISYYDEQSPQKIAEAIMECRSVNAEFNCHLLSKLDSEFQDDIVKILEN